MGTQLILRSLLLRCQTLAVAICATILVTPAFAQQSPEADSTVDRQNAEVQVVAENLDGPVTESSSRDDQPPASFPDAPSTLSSLKTGSLSFGDRFVIYRHSVLRPWTVLGPALGASVGQWENEPPQWGLGTDGYARRLASGMGRHFIAETIRFAAAAADGEDPRYRRSEETGVWGRARHAIVETFTSQTSSGTRIPAFSRFAGTYGAAFVSNLWYPDSRATTGWALRRGSTALGSSLGFHLIEEFMPRKYFKALGLAD